MTSPKLKASERQSILAKLTTPLRKKYAKSEPKAKRNVFETLLFAACLEDAPTALAEETLQKLIAAFFDLNEIRVSSISQIEKPLAPLGNASWRALRIRDALHTVFEAHYKFDLEHLKRKTHEQAHKDLSAYRHATPFMRNYVMQHCLDGHVLPLDGASLQLLIWLGLIEPGTSVEAATEELKSSVRKSDAEALCHLLHECAVDPEHNGSLQLSAAERKAGVDPHQALERLNGLLNGSFRKKPAGGKAPAAEAERADRKPAPAAKAAAPLTKSVKKPASKPAANPSAQRDKASGGKSVTKPVPKKLTKKPAKK